MFSHIPWHLSKDSHQQILTYTLVYRQETEFYAQKPGNLVKMLIQGPMGLYLHIFQKLKCLESFSLLSSVDGGIQWLNEQDFYSQLKISPSRDPLLILLVLHHDSLAQTKAVNYQWTEKNLQGHGTHDSRADDPRPSGQYP